MDVRIERDGARNYRNILIGAGVSLRYKNLPGLNTFKVDTEAGVAFKLTETTLDITTTYGHADITPLADIPKYTLDYSELYNFTDLSSSTISK